MSKYDPLFRHLCTLDDDAMELTFDNIEQLVGPLPAAATTRREWWTNDQATRPTHARAWLDAGRQVETVDRTAGKSASALPDGGAAPDTHPWGAACRVGAGRAGARHRMARRKFSVELECANTAPSVARHLVGTWLDGLGCEGEAHAEAVLVVSELVSAAVNERVGIPTLDAELWHDTLVVWVTNGTSLHDDSAPDDHGDLRARVLSATCDDWGSESGAAGTRQWAWLDLDNRVGHAS
jgi:hypothetical protein